jgi:hypothetical protein
MEIKTRIQDVEIYNLINKLEKDPDALENKDVYIAVLRTIVDTRALLRRVLKEIRPTSNRKIVSVPTGDKDEIVTGA